MTPIVNFLLKFQGWNTACHRDAEWKSVLFKVASEVEQVDRALFLRQLGLLRPLIDGHLRTMRMIGGVKVSVAANVILQLNHCVREVFGITGDFLTLPRDEDPHPFLQELSKTGSVRSGHLR